MLLSACLRALHRTSPYLRASKSSVECKTSVRLEREGRDAPSLYCLQSDLGAFEWHVMAATGYRQSHGASAASSKRAGLSGKLLSGLRRATSRKLQVEHPNRHKIVSASPELQERPSSLPALVSACKQPRTSTCSGSACVEMERTFATSALLNSQSYFASEDCGQYKDALRAAQSATQ